MKWFYIISISLFAGMFSCNNEKSSSTRTDESEKEFIPTGELSDLVRNPMRPDGTIDSSFLPIITWKDTVYEFGEVIEGDVVTKEFAFTNTGTAPLLITEAKSTCGCTIPEWPRGLIQPDSGGVVLVKFNTLNRTGAQSKEVTIFANTFPNQSKVTVKGRVIKKNN